MDKSRPQRKILRSPSVKRKSKVLPVNQRVQLQRVLGITVSSNAAVSCDSNYGTIAYPAGCVVVLFNPRRNKQSHIFNTTKKPVTCLAFSHDGKHLVTGETGHQPAVRVWDVQEKTQVAEFRGHKFGINCVAFSPNMKEVVSVGTQHDQMINVWNWKSGNKVASNKVSSKVSALAFSEDGKCFVTVGNRHVRFWYLEDKRSKINQTVPLMGRSGILGDQKDNFFCDVVAGQGHMCGRFFVITQSGLLCEFNEKRQLDKWVELRAKSANCITAGQEHIFVGCAEGVVRVFSATSLHYLCSLPKPHHLGVEVTTATNPSHLVSNRQDARYPDVKAIAIDDDHKKVTCIYNDRSVYIWDVHDIKRVGKAWSFLYHSGCIWSLEMYPSLEDETMALLPPGSFLTASGDDTIRVWNLNTHMPENTAFKRNIYSNELLKIVYVDPSLASLCDVDYNPAGAADKTDTSYGGKNGVRSIRVSPDGADLASGDRQGNIRVYDMQYLNEKKSVEAHESDVMCLEYTYTNYGRFLATSSRDRLIHVFDVDENYGLLQTIADHSSSITAVRFTDSEKKLRMISCGADKSILLRNAVVSPEFQFQLEHHLATKITLYDMVIDPTQKLLATACQDRNVRLYNIQTTKEKKCYKGSVGDEGVLLRIHLDPSGTYAVTTCTDKNVCILDFHTGELVATMYGHSEVITGVKFANDLKHVITVSADGCIFVWRLPVDMTNQIKGRLLELGKTLKDMDYFRSDQSMMPNPVMLNSPAMDGAFPVVKSASTGHIPMFDDDFHDGKDDRDDDPEALTSLDNLDDGSASLDYRFSIGQLPNWAKAKFADNQSEGSESSQEQVQPKGRWAQRVDHNVEFKSQLDLTSEEDTLTDQLRSPEASASKLSDLRRETVVLGKQQVNKNLPHIGSTGDLQSLPSAHKPFHNFEASRKSDGLDQYKSDTSLNKSSAAGKRWSDRFDLLKSNSLEFDDTDDLDTGSDTTEIIYPPTDSESDQFASSYKVFAADDVKQDKADTSQGNASNQDDNSVSTDPVSLEDEDDPNDETLAISSPTTPVDPDKEFLSRTPDKEDFVRENFEEDSFTPVPLEKFTRSLETLEQQANSGAVTGSVFESTPFSPRLSLSARFMSRAQVSTFRNFSASQITYRQDNWHSRNKVEMSRAMDETRKSLLAMNLRRNSSESESPEKEDPPSPPTKLEESSTFSNANQPRTSYPASPPTEAEYGAKSGPKDVAKSPSHAQNHLPHRTNHVTASSSFAQKISEERERRSSDRSGEQSDPSHGVGVEGSAQKFVNRARPTFFRTALSSKSRPGRSSDISADSSSVVADKSRDSSSKKMSAQGRLLGSKLAFYASTPNLISGLGDDEDEVEKETEKSLQTTTKLTSPISNLHQLADLSRSVPDVKDADSCMDSSGTSRSSKQPRRSVVVVGQKKVPSKFPVAANSKQVMGPPQFIPSSSSSSSRGSSVTFAQSKNNTRESLPSSSRRKSSSSELTLNQAKNILLGKSGVLTGSNKPLDSNVSTSGTISRSVKYNGVSSTAPSDQPTPSTVTSGNSQHVIDPKLSHISPKQLAVAEEIEHTANMLRHQKQANICNTFSSEHIHAHSSNLEASPFDLPERDQPIRHHFSPKQPPLLTSLSSQQQNLGLQASQTFQPSISSRLSADPDSLGTKSEDDGIASDSVFDDVANVKSVRDRIAQFQSQSPSRGSTTHNQSPHRRILPASPSTATAHHDNTHSDPGQGSVSSDTDSSGNSPAYADGSKSKTMVSTTQQNKDRAILPSQLSSATAGSTVSLSYCQSVTKEFRSQMHLLRELFAQVEGRTDETSEQILAMLGDVLHETKFIIADLASRVPSPPQRNTDVSSLDVQSLSASSSPPPSSSQMKTFHSAASRPSFPETTDDSSKIISSSTAKGSGTEETAVADPEHKGAILTATKDLLQPLVSQLSQDLSEGILKLIRERVDETF